MWVEAGFTKEIMAMYEETEMLIILIWSLHCESKAHSFTLTFIILQLKARKSLQLYEGLEEMVSRRLPS